MIYYIKYSCTTRAILKWTLNLLTYRYIDIHVHIVHTGYNPVNIKLGLQFRKCTFYMLVSISQDL